MWVKIADYQDQDCIGCTCCYVTTIGGDDYPLCPSCEFAHYHPHIDQQIECHDNDCNIYKETANNG